MLYANYDIPLLQYWALLVLQWNFWWTKSYDEAQPRSNNPIIADSRKNPILIFQLMEY